MELSATATIHLSNCPSRLDFTSFSNVVNGKLVRTTKTRHGINPSTEEQLWEVPIAAENDLDDAVNSARDAFKSWSNTSLCERKAALEAFAKGFEAYRDDFARLLTIEQGKPFRLATAEVDKGTEWIRGINQIEISEDVLEEDHRTIVIRYTPLGVVGAIIPWNFPIQLVFAKIAPALVTGNTIIVKPSPLTPYCGLKIVELAQQFFPPGVVQVLSGDDCLGPWITAHPGINKISFTGSTATGKRVMEIASKTLKRITLELGGKDAAIVCKEVDIATVAPIIARLAFSNSGQICLAVKRVYIHESIYPEFRETMVQATKQLKVGGGFTDGVCLGPVQNQMQYNRVRTFFDDIGKEGQKVAIGGRLDRLSQGYFVQPTIIDNPSHTSRIVLEEPFGKTEYLFLPI
jgi:acyl-CoA reductase-like NAD-dependent aldehyde dehydrogenase